MKVTGYALREAMRVKRLDRDAAAKLFAESLFIFEGQTSETELLFTRFREADMAVARLETIQETYSLGIVVEAQGKSMSLTEAVKLVGGAGRAEKMWRDASGASKSRRGYYDQGAARERGKDTEYAKRSVPVEVALKKAHDAGRRGSALRAAISKGNGVEKEPKEVGTTDEELNTLGLA